MIAWSESACVRRTSFAFSFVLQLITWIGSLIGLGAPILLTDRSENEKRSRLGGSSFGMGRGGSAGVCAFLDLNFLRAIVEGDGSSFSPLSRFRTSVGVGLASPQTIS